MDEAVHIKINSEKVKEICMEINNEIKKYKEFDEYGCHF